MKRKHYLLLVVLTVVAGLIFSYTKPGAASPLAFSPDGKYLVHVSDSWTYDDCAMTLWEVGTGRAVQSFYGHTKWIISVAFSPDGKYILSGSFDNTIKKWDIASGYMISSIEVTLNDRGAIAFSPDAQHVLYESEYGKLVIRGISTGSDSVYGRLLRSFYTGRFETVSVAFSPNGQHILSIDLDGAMSLYHTDTGQEVRTFRDQRLFRGSKAAFSPDGNYILSTGIDGYYMLPVPWNSLIMLWDVNKGEMIYDLPSRVKYINQVAFSPNGRYLLSGGNDDSEEETLILRDMSTGKEIRSFPVTYAVRSLAFSPDGRYIAVDVTDTDLYSPVVCIQLWDVSTGQLVKSFPLNKDLIGKPKYEVIRIIDGDTVELMIDGKPTTVRLIGVDTPETVHPQKPVERYGKEASMFTANLLKGEEVYIEQEPGNTVDKYGRTLLYLYRAPDGLFVNMEIVRQGYGHAYTTYPFQYMELFIYYEARAREAAKGLWSNGNGKRQWQW